MESIQSNLQEVTQQVEEANNDREKLIKQLEQQVKCSTQQREDIEKNFKQIQELTTAKEDLETKKTKQEKDFVLKLMKIFDRIDIETSMALIDPTYDQLFGLIEGKLTKMNLNPTENSKSKEVTEL